MSYDLKRGFHRVFAVLTVLWVLLCAVYPMWERDRFFSNSLAEHAQKRMNCNVCPDYLSGTSCMKVVSDCKKGVDELNERMFREDRLSKWYAEAWPFIVVFAVVVPILVYAAIRAIVAVILWVKKGFQTSEGIRPGGGGQNL